MKLLFFLILGFTTLSHAADDIAIVDVRRNITLSEKDTIYKDFYIRNSPLSGFKKNLVVTAVRKINIRDASGANAVGEIKVPVGQLRIIAIFDKVAVAREYSLLSRDELPMLEQVGIMVGDSIDTKGAFIDNSKPKTQRNVAEAASSGEPLTIASKVSIVASPTSPNPVVSAIPAKALQPVVQGTASSNGETLEKTADSGNNSGHE